MHTEAPEFSDRQSEILALIRQRGRVDVDALSESYAVSTQTIRRDLNELCDRGLATRVHGGARRSVSVSNFDYEDRRRHNSKAKTAIGDLAAGLIPNDCSITLNIGTTTEQVARALSGHVGLMVISNNVNIISALIGAKARDLILVGGSVRQSDGAIVGHQAVEFIDGYKVDFAVIGASAIDDDGAILDFDAREVVVARAILRNARTRILVADAGKFERSAPIRICTLADLDYFVTDIEPPAAFRKAAEEAGVRILTGRKPAASAGA